MKQKKLGKKFEGRDLFNYYFHITVHPQMNLGQMLKQERNLKTESDTEAMEVCCLVGCFPLLAQSVFL